MLLTIFYCYPLFCFYIPFVVYVFVFISILLYCYFYVPFIFISGIYFSFPSSCIYLVLLFLY